MIILIISAVEVWKKQLAIKIEGTNRLRKNDLFLAFFSFSINEKIEKTMKTMKINIDIEAINITDKAIFFCKNIY